MPCDKPLRLTSVGRTHQTTPSTGVSHHIFVIKADLRPVSFRASKTMCLYSTPTKPIYHGLVRSMLDRALIFGWTLAIIG